MVNRSMKRNKSMKMGRSMNKSRGRKMRGGWPWDAKKEEEVKDINTTMNPMHPQSAEGQGQKTESLLDQASSLVSGTGEKVENNLTLAQNAVTDTGANFLSNPLSFIKGSETVANGPVANGQQTPVANGTGTGTGTGTEEEKSWNPFGGGRRRSKSRQLRGGLNQSFGYNAAPVMDSVTSEPTYMIKGGKRRRKRSSKKRRSCKKRRGCKKSCKRHRHRR